MTRETTLISTFYSFDPFVPIAHKYSPTRIVLIVEKDKMNAIQADIAKVRDVYGKVATIEVTKVEGGDLVSIAQETVHTIESEKGDKIVNITGAERFIGQGVLYGCYARHDLIKTIVCQKIGDKTIAELPKLSYGITTAKRKLLSELSKKEGRTIAQIAKKIGVTPANAYQHLKELREQGYADDEFNITLAGKLALI